jgi:hypothetical protein
VGPLPSELQMLPQLEELRLEHNAITGTVAMEICDKSFLTFAADCAGAAPKVLCTCCTECY